MDAPISSLQVIASVICLVAGIVLMSILFVRIQSPNIVSNVDNVSDHEKTIKSNRGNQSFESANNRTKVVNSNDESNEPKGSKSNNTWKCACEGGGIFLPPSLMKNLGGPGAALRLGTGICYHKQM